MHSARVRTVLTYIAANVRRHRITRGMTQERLADAADVTLTFLQQVETGKANPSVAVLVSIADVLEVTPGALFRPAKMPEIKRGRPRKLPAAAPGKGAPKAPAATPAPGKATRKARGKATRKAPGT